MSLFLMFLWIMKDNHKHWLEDIYSWTSDSLASELKPVRNGLGSSLKMQSCPSRLLDCLMTFMKIIVGFQK